MSVKTEIKKLLREVQLEGWLVTKGRKHYRLMPPGGGPMIFVSATPSDQRTLANVRSQIKRYSRTFD